MEGLETVIAFVSQMYYSNDVLSEALAHLDSKQALELGITCAHLTVLMFNLSHIILH